MKEEQIQVARAKINRIIESISRVFVGKRDLVTILLNGFISSLHVLIEDVPGVGKTTLAKALSSSIGMDFTRIQFTPDLLPGDIVGMTVWSQEKRDFVYKEGAIMHRFILADEINRASPRTQASLLEAMQEGSVSVDGHTFRLPTPFFVVATQNPSDFTGVFQLPEGEVDRFGISFSIGYPTRDDEKEILKRFQVENPLEELQSVIKLAEILDIQRMVASLHTSDHIRDYIIDIVDKTRSNRYIRLGASPRAAQHLQRAAQGRSFLAGRTYLIPEDVKEMTASVLAHRLVLSSEARMSNKSAREILGEILKECKIPVRLR